MNEINHTIQGPMKALPYALINLKSLKVLEFPNKTQLQDAANQYSRRDIEFVPLQWSPGDEQYHQMETWR